MEKEMNWKEEVLQIVERIRENANNKKFKAIIESPWKFYHSIPGKYGKADDKNKGETSWQRECFDKDKDLWFDLELPIGQQRNEETGRLSTLRVDLIGKMDSRPVICEMKKTSKAGQPFDAILQLLAYYCMIKQNAKLLDENKIHRDNAHNKEFCWDDIANNNPILMLRANEPYWSNWSKTTDKNEAAKEIIKVCKKYGLEIQLWNEEGRIE